VLEYRFFQQTKKTEGNLGQNENKVPLTDTPKMWKIKHYIWKALTNQKSISPSTKDFVQDGIKCV
jgi:hypothetical protein